MGVKIIFTCPKKKLGSFWRLPWREKAWLFILFPISGFIRLSLLTIRFRWLVRSLGQHYKNHQVSSLVSQQELDVAWRIGRITALVARYTPWQSKCLVQAVMARILLNFYHIPHVICLGARLTGDHTDPMKAHAWVKVGPWVVTGREGHQSYPVVSVFVSSTLLPQKINRTHVRAHIHGD